MTDVDGPVELTVTSPATGQVVGSVPVTDEVGVVDAIARARTASVAWGATPVAERAAHLGKIRRSLVADADHLAKTLHDETGKPLPDALFEITAACALTRYAEKAAAKALRRQRVDTVPLLLKQAWVEYSPFGVVGIITPWNYPVGILFQSLPYVLAAGNAAVLKPSELAPLTGQALAEVVNGAGIDLVQVVQGAGATGATLVRGDIDMAVFTGSVTTGKRIAAATAERLLPVVLELGGKDPFIVCADAQVDLAARNAVGAAFSNAGQTCMAPERVIVHESVYDDFVRRVVELTAELRLGSSPTDHVGPLVVAGHAAHLLDRLAGAVESGARVVAGGRLRDGTAYMEPTVVVDVDPASELYRQESFGPIVCVLRARDDEEAIRLANDSPMGLNAAVFSSEPAHARAIAARLDTGGVTINDVMVGAAVAALPFGGEKESGLGRLQGAQAFRTFSRARSVTRNRTRAGAGFAGRMFVGRRPSPALLRRAMKLVYGR